MNNELYTITGKIENLKSLPKSSIGYPRFSFTVDGQEIKTLVNHYLGWVIADHENKIVKLQLGKKYLKKTVIEVFNIWEIK